MKALARLSLNYIRHSRRHMAFAAVGLTAGVATLAFFLALSAGVRQKVLNRLYPVNQVEFQVERVSLFGLGLEVPASLEPPVISAISHLQGVRSVHPKQRSGFQARLWGGRDVFGSTLRVEAFFDGLEPVLIRDELRQSEEGVLGKEDTGVACLTDGDCGPGSFCDSRRCVRRSWWNRFDSVDSVYRCRSDQGCIQGEACLNGECVISCDSSPGRVSCPSGMGCRAGACRRLCEDTGMECRDGELCAVDGMCARLSCSLSGAEVQMSDGGDQMAGTVTGLPGAAANRTLPEVCPGDSYCAVPGVSSSSGYCEPPIPVLLSPFILDIYNDAAAPALGMQRLAGPELALGLKFSMMFGESYFAADMPSSMRVVRRCRIVGFSPKALDLGVTMPLIDAMHANAAMLGREKTSSYSSVVVEATSNEDVPRIIQDMKSLGLVLSPRSESGRKAANVLMVLTLVFGGVSLIVLLVSGINIAHTFGMLVSERRREIAVYRAVGATLLDIRLIVAGEAVFLGFAGGTSGILLGWLASRMVNLLAAPVLSRIPGSPGDLFGFSPAILSVCMGISILFALAGAWGPARSASRTDPTVVLSQE